MLENHKQKLLVKWAITGSAVLGISYLSYRYYQHYIRDSQPPTRKISEISHDEQRLNTIQSNYSQFYFDKEEQLKAVLNQISHKGPTIEDIYLLSPLILVDEFVKYTKEIRKRRRLIRKSNEEQYVGLIRNYELQVKELLERGREEVLQEFNRNLDDLERMESAFEMFDNLQDLRKRALQQLMTNAYPSKKLRRIPKEKLRRIMQQEINFIGTKMYDRLKNKLQDQEDSGVSQQQIHKIILTLIDDIVYQKYGYERQEIEHKISQLPLLAKDLKKARNNLFAQIGQFNMDSLQSPEVSESGDNKISASSKTQILDESKENE